MALSPGGVGSQGSPGGPATYFPLSAHEVALFPWASYSP